MGKTVSTRTIFAASAPRFSLASDRRLVRDPIDAGRAALLILLESRLLRSIRGREQRKKGRKEEKKKIGKFRRKIHSRERNRNRARYTEGWETMSADPERGEIRAEGSKGLSIRLARRRVDRERTRGNSSASPTVFVISRRKKNIIHRDTHTHTHTRTQRRDR